MTESTEQYAGFRLTLERQQKRAKALLKQLKANDNAAWQCVQNIMGNNNTSRETVKLATAQYCIARELRFANWAALKQHIATMEQQRSVLAQPSTVLDGDLRTMHIRCGHDLQHTLKQAGFHGDFNLHINPYLEGPVTADSDWLEQRARFICDSYGDSTSLNYDKVLADCHAEEQRLQSASQGNYERVVLWLEHDRYDQFVLLRCLAWLAEHGAPPILELVGPRDFPGGVRFRGLGQLPPEALRLLWQQRQTISKDQLLFAQDVWQAFRSANPELLAHWVRTGTPLLPDLRAALLRHLQELPAPLTGLGLTQQLLLQTLAKHGPMSAGRLVALVMHELDPLPGLGDNSYDQHLRAMAAIPTPLLRRDGDHPLSDWHLDQLTISKTGKAVLAGQFHWLTLPVPERWVGGICIQPSTPTWYWDKQNHKPIKLDLSKAPALD